MRDSERLLKASTPLPILRKQSEVKVYMGAGWEKGTVRESTREHLTVWLGRRNCSTTCRDARNIQPL